MKTKPSTKHIKKVEGTLAKSQKSPRRFAPSPIKVQELPKKAYRKALESKNKKTRRLARCKSRVLRNFCISSYHKTWLGGKFVLRTASQYREEIRTVLEFVVLFSQIYLHDYLS